LIYHTVSIAFGLFLHLVGKCPGWTIESVSYNKYALSLLLLTTRSHACCSVSSFPILLWYTLYQLTKFKGGETLLSHLRWRAMESTEDVYQRGLVYLVINLVLTELAR
jgi:hypothetical protein